MEPRGFQIGEYQVRSRLGRGGMGEIWLATRAGKSFVVKTLLPHLADDPRIVEMFIKEGRVASRVDHPNVVKVHEVGESEGRHYLVQEYVEGASLDRIIQHQGRLPAPLAALIAERACAGLSAIHGFSVVHRDISPSNLLLSVNGEVKVTDFGIAKTFTTEPGGTTTVGTTKGKIAYMSPEQASGELVDARTDVFAMGIVLYEMLAGVLPYDETRNDFEMLSRVVYGRRRTVSESLWGSPPALKSALESALTLDPADRWATAKELREAIELYSRAVQPRATEQDVGILVRDFIRAHGDQANRKSARSLEPAPAPRNEGSFETRDVRKHVPLEDNPPTDIEPSLAVVTDRNPAFAPRRRVILGAASALLLLGLFAGYQLIPSGEAPASQLSLSPLLAAVVLFDAGVAEVAVVEEEPVLVDAGVARTPPPRPRPPQKLETLTLTTEPPCEIFQGSRRLGPSPLELAIPSKPVTLRLFSAQHGIDFSAPLAAKAGEKTARIQVPRATLQVRVNPWAEVTLDGRPLGVTPIPSAPIYAGRHVIQLVNNELGARRQLEIELSAGEVRVVREKF